MSTIDHSGIDDSKPVTGDTIANHPKAEDVRDNETATKAVFDQVKTDIEALESVSFSDPTTTRGDLITRGAANVTRLGIGADGEHLMSDGTDPVWSPILMATYSGGGTASVGTMTLHEMQTGVHSKGMALKNGDGGVVINGATAIDIGAGRALIRPTNDKTAILEYLEWGDVEAEELSGFASDADVHVYLDYAGGSTIKTLASDPDPGGQNQTIIKLAHIHRVGTNVDEIHDIREFVGNHPQEFTELHKDVFGVLVSGQGCAETGTRKLSIGLGKFHVWGYNNHSVTSFDSNVSDTFSYFHIDSTEPTGFLELTGQTQLDNLQYDDGSDALATLGSNKWKKDWIYRDILGDVYVVYSQAQYNSEQAAIDAPEPSLPPRATAAGHAYALCNWRIVKGDASGTLFDIANRFNPLGSAGTSDHGSLGGLGDLDHPATAIINAPAGNIEATDVQAAIYELDTEKLALAGGTMTGLLATNGQLKFPATQNPSADVNTLDDYEEGTFTFGMVPSTSGSITLDVDAGTYVKVGRKVTICGRARVGSVSSPLGILRLTGLPFTVASGSQYDSALSILPSAMSSGATTSIVGKAREGRTFCELHQFTAGAISSTLAAQMQANSDIKINCTYFV